MIALCPRFRQRPRPHCLVWHLPGGALETKLLPRLTCSSRSHTSPCPSDLPMSQPAENTQPCCTQLGCQVSYRPQYRRWHHIWLLIFSTRTESCASVDPHGKSGQLYTGSCARHVNVSLPHAWRTKRLGFFDFLGLNGAESGIANKRLLKALKSTHEWLGKEKSSNAALMFFGFNTLTIE